MDCIYAFIAIDLTCDYVDHGEAAPTLLELKTIKGADGKPYAEAAPTLLELKTIKGADGKPLKIVKKIAAHDYTTFGMCLLQDENGEEVDLLKKNHIHNGAESVTEAILQKWLTSDAPTRTYQHLIECLRQSELGALAELIANTTGMPVMNEETVINS